MKAATKAKYFYSRNIFSVNNYTTEHEMVKDDPNYYVHNYWLYFCDLQRTTERRLEELVTQREVIQDEIQEIEKLASCCNLHIHAK